MTNAEKARELCKLYQANRASLFQHLLAMAEWKDEQLKQTREDANNLYDEISDCIDRIVKSRLLKDEIGESNALQQMESIMVKTQQFLQTI